VAGGTNTAAPAPQVFSHLPAGFAMHQDDWLFGFSVRKDRGAMPDQEQLKLGTGIDPADCLRAGDVGLSKGVLPEEAAYGAVPAGGDVGWRVCDDIQVSRVSFEGKESSITFANCLPDREGQFKSAG
jgi:hypothetical protein